MEEHQAEQLRVIANTYRHWVEMVDELDYPGFDDCPLCRYSRQERRRRIHAKPMASMCIVCPVVLYTGDECCVDEDFDKYSSGVGSILHDQDQVHLHGVQVQDKILSLWLDVLDGRTVEDWR